jgi:hypothetical protein
LDTLLEPECPEIISEFQPSRIRVTYEKEEVNRYTVHRKRMAKLEAMGDYLDIEFEANWKHTLTLDEDTKLEFNKVHKRTILFDRGLLRRMPMFLEYSREKSEGLGSPHSVRRLLYETKNTANMIRELSFLIADANVLNKKLIALVGQSEPVTDAMKFNVCESLLKSDRVSGATHFVSGVQLGASVVRTSITQEAQIGKEKGVGGNVAAKFFRLGVKVDEQKSSKHDKSCKHLMELMDPRVEFNDDGTLPTNFPMDQDVVIGLQVCPITELVPYEWRAPLQRVCIKRLNEEHMKKPATPGKDKNEPYLLRAGKFWLKADEYRIVATEIKEEASHFYVIPNSDSPSIFSIEYRKPDDTVWYVFADSKQEDDLKLQKAIENENGLFKIYFVHEGKKATFSDWSNKPLLIRRANKRFLKKNYLSVQKTPETNERRLTFCGNPSSTEMETQFIIENAPRSAMCFKKD